MKKIIMLAFVLLLLSCCTDSDKKNISESSADAAANNSSVISNDSFKFPIQTYAVYEVFNSNSTDNEFDQIMLKNPIEQKMYAELKNTDISGTREAQVFYDKYVQMWQEELTFSINNLKKYLSSEDLKNLETAQSKWEESLKSSNEFDRKLIENRKIGLGTQYVSSSLIYLISQYRERVFHIKYMTMLSETYIENEVPDNELLWNKFIISE